MIGAVLLAHLVGDYLLQSHWMAQEKVRHWWPALVHGVLYTVPFYAITQSWSALAVIAGTHVVIDRYRLAKYVVWLKNWLAPVRVRRSVGGPYAARSWFELESYNPSWRECRATGGPPGQPAYLAVWLLFIADNTIHVLLAVAAIRWLG